MLSNHLEHLADMSLGRPVAHDDLPAPDTNAHHFGGHELRARREHRADQAHHDVERGIRIRQILGIAFVDLNTESLVCCLGPSLLHQVGREVETVT